MAFRTMPRDRFPYPRSGIVSRLVPRLASRAAFLLAISPCGIYPCRLIGCRIRTRVRFRIVLPMRLMA